jgi:hypothetical protein
MLDNCGWERETIWNQLEMFADMVYGDLAGGFYGFVSWRQLMELEAKKPEMMPRG